MDTPSSNRLPSPNSAVKAKPLVLSPHMAVLAGQKTCSVGVQENLDLPRKTTEVLPTITFKDYA